jgi:hypothetical protein
LDSWKGYDRNYFDAKVSSKYLCSSAFCFPLKFNALPAPFQL